MIPLLFSINFTVYWAIIFRKRNVMIMNDLIIALSILCLITCVISLVLAYIVASKDPEDEII